MDKVAVDYGSTIPEALKKSLGIVYTPQWLASHIVNNAISQWKKFNNSRGEPQRVADLCCGTGVFLAELFSQAKRQDWAPEVFGYDIDPNVIDVCRNALPKNLQNSSIANADTLVSKRICQNST